MSSGMIKEGNTSTITAIKGANLISADKENLGVGGEIVTKAQLSEEG
jgi:hypothetical protein